MRSARTPQLTRQTMVILSILMGAHRPVAGSALASESGLASGTLYPILIRLETAGWVTSAWEDGESERPRRRVYRVTGQGIRYARQEAAAWKTLVERLV
jgi:PadR family transcriptional regulator PadR